jgi:fructose-1,6-bisphosphatase-3
MDRLLDYHSVDIQWGNHDIVWMGAGAGSEACIANVIRICLRYANMETLENGYAISMLPLASLAMDVYGEDPCEIFRPKGASQETFTENEMLLMARMHKAITIIQFKLEAQIITRRPHYEMADRLLLDKVDYERGMLILDGQEYPLKDGRFPTIDPDDPYQLSEQEKIVIERLKLSFANSEKLQQHIRFLFARGSMYLVYNNNLLYHGCIAMEEDGSFMAFNVDGQAYRAKAFMDRVERLARQGYFSGDLEQKQYGMDAIWYLWSGPMSPLFGKKKMATFERYLLTDESLREEKMNAYYELRYQEETADKILREFGLDPETAHIVNGHVPVKVNKGESPIKANGKLIVIDGGFSKAYQKETGIAGYTLIYNSYGLMLAAHEPFESTQLAIEEEIDIHSRTQILQRNTSRIWIQDADQGIEIQERIKDLNALLGAYRAGLIKER